MKVIELCKMPPFTTPRRVRSILKSKGIQPKHQQDVRRLLTQIFTQVTVRDPSGTSADALLVVRAGSLVLVHSEPRVCQSKE